MGSNSHQSEPLLRSNLWLNLPVETQPTVAQDTQYTGLPHPAQPYPAELARVGGSKEETAVCWHLVYGEKGQLGCKKGREQMSEFSLLGANLGVGTKIALSHDVSGGTLIL